MCTFFAKCIYFKTIYYNIPSAELPETSHNTRKPKMLKADETKSRVSDVMWCDARKAEIQYIKVQLWVQLNPCGGAVAQWLNLTVVGGIRISGVGRSVGISGVRISSGCSIGCTVGGAVGQWCSGVGAIGQWCSQHSGLGSHTGNNGEKAQSELNDNQLDYLKELQQIVEFKYLRIWTCWGGFCWVVNYCVVCSEELDWCL